MSIEVITWEMVKQLSYIPALIVSSVVIAMLTMHIIYECVNLYYTRKEKKNEK